MSLYISTPLSNSLNLINFEDSGYLGLGDFLIGGSDFGKNILNFIGIEPGVYLEKTYYSHNSI